MSESPAATAAPPAPRRAPAVILHEAVPSSSSSTPQQGISHLSVYCRPAQLDLHGALPIVISADAKAGLVLLRVPVIREGRGNQRYNDYFAYCNGNRAPISSDSID